MLISTIGVSFSVEGVTVSVTETVNRVDFHFIKYGVKPRICAVPHPDYYTDLSVVLTQGWFDVLNEVLELTQSNSQFNTIIDIRETLICSCNGDDIEYEEVRP